MQQDVKKGFVFVTVRVKYGGGVSEEIGCFWDMKMTQLFQAYAAFFGFSAFSSPAFHGMTQSPVQPFLRGADKHSSQSEDSLISKTLQVESLTGVSASPSPSPSSSPSMGTIVKEGTASIGKFPVNIWGKLNIRLNSTARVSRVTGNVLLDHSAARANEIGLGRNTYIWSNDLSVDLMSPWNHQCHVRNVITEEGQFQNSSVIKFEFDNFQDTAGNWDQASGIWSLLLRDRGQEYVGDIVYYRFEFHTLCIPPVEPPPPKLLSTTNSSASILWSPCGDYGGCNLTAVHIAMSYRGSDESCDPESPNMPSGFTIVYVGDTIRRRYTRMGLKPGSRYAFKTRMVNQAGISDWSEETEISTDAGVPMPPTKLGARDYSHNSLHITWDEPAGNGAEVSSYDVQMQPAEESPIWVDVGSTSELFYWVEGLQPDNKYRFRVRGNNIAGAGNWSEVALLGTTEPPPEEPSAPTVSGRSSTSLDLEWAPGNNHGNPMTNYKLEQSQDSWGPFILVYHGSTPSCTVEGLLADTTYWFRVAAENPMGMSSFAGPASFETLKEQRRSELNPLPPKVSPQATSEQSNTVQKLSSKPNKKL